MSVCVSPTDYTWHHHVDGFLALLCHQQDATSSPIFLHLATALQLLDTSLQVVTPPTQLLTISLLRLRSLVRELRASTADKPLQIELLKYRIALKNAYADIQLLSSSFVGSIVDDLTCRALVIVAGKVLVRTGELVTSRSFGATRSSAKLAHAIYDAGLAIYDVVLAYCGNDTATKTTPPMGMVRMMWPLCAAHIAAYGYPDDAQRCGEIQELLTRIGYVARMPVALALVSL
jgi:hypothetical protein